jgi:hypothetical protein
MRSALFLLLVTLAACTRNGSPRADSAPAPDAGATEASAAAGVVPSAAAAESPGSAAAEPAPSGAEDGGAQAPEAAVDAAPPVPLSAVVAVVGGKDLPIARDGSALVDAGTSFRLEVAVPLGDGRLALYDEDDAMVASSGTNEVGASWTRYRLVPDEPLHPGTTYVLRLDGALTRDVHDLSGRPYGPLVLTVKTAGDRPPPAASPRKRRGKRRR